MRAHGLLISIAAIEIRSVDGRGDGVFSGVRFSVF